MTKLAQRVPAPGSVEYNYLIYKMKSPKTLSIITIILGVIALIGIFLSRVAVKKIYQGIDPDLTLEWTIIRVSFAFTVAFVIMTVVTLLKWRKDTRLPDN